MYANISFVFFSYYPILSKDSNKKILGYQVTYVLFTLRYRKPSFRVPCGISGLHILVTQNGSLLRVQILYLMKESNKNVNT